MNDYMISISCYDCYQPFRRKRTITGHRNSFPTELIKYLDNHFIQLQKTDYTFCYICKIDTPYIKDINRYVTCPKCRADIYVGTEKTYKWGKHKRTKTT